MLNCCQSKPIDLSPTRRRPTIARSSISQRHDGGFFPLGDDTSISSFPSPPPAFDPKPPASRSMSIRREGAVDDSTAAQQSQRRGFAFPSILKSCMRCLPVRPGVQGRALLEIRNLPRSRCRCGSDHRTRLSAPRFAWLINCALLTKGEGD